MGVAQTAGETYLVDGTVFDIEVFGIFGVFAEVFGAEGGVIEGVVVDHRRGVVSAGGEGSEYL